MKRPIIGIIIPLVLVWLGSFGCEETKFAPPPTYDVTGEVSVDGTMRDVTGNELGAIAVFGLDGIRVLLVEGSGDLNSIVLSDSGSYTFQGIEAGDYTTKSTVNSVDFVSTGTYTVTDTDLVVPDTLRVTSQGDVAVYPNPNDGVVTIKVNQQAQGTLAVNILSVDQRTVRRLVSQQSPPGVHTLVWDGRDDGGQLVPDGAYWALVNSAGTLKHELIVRDTTP